MQNSSPVVALRLGATVGGISLDLSVGISREAFENAAAGAAVGSLQTGTQCAPLDLDLPALYLQMPELLAQGLQAQHRNLAAESLRVLQVEMAERSSVLAAAEAQ